MRELGVEGLSEDHRFLIVRDPVTDERLRIPIGAESADVQPQFSDPASEPAGDVSHAATVSEQPMVTHLSPREIQTRVRRGETVDDIVESSGMAVNTVDAFAGPVLAERAHMARQAGRTTVRRKHVTGTGVRLEDLIAENLRAQGGTIEGAEWDAFRREDGRWTVIVTPPSSEVTATFLYDIEGRYVLPVDESAHDLVGDVAEAAKTPVEMELAEAVRDRAPLPQQDDEATDHELPPFEDVAAATSHHELELDLELPADIAAAESLLNRDGAVAYPAVSSLKEARDRRAQSSAALESEPKDEQVVEAQHLDEVIEHDIAVPDSPRPKTKRPERRHVPSWDEIMFGDRQD